MPLVMKFYLFYLTKNKINNKYNEDAYGPKSNENEMSIEMPTRILTIPRSLINLKEYEELVGFY